MDPYYTLVAINQTRIDKFLIGRAHFSPPTHVDQVKKKEGTLRGESFNKLCVSQLEKIEKLNLFLCIYNDHDTMKTLRPCVLL